LIQNSTLPLHNTTDHNLMLPIVGWLYLKKIIIETVHSFVYAAVV